METPIWHCSAGYLKCCRASKGYFTRELHELFVKADVFFRRRNNEVFDKQQRAACYMQQRVTRGVQPMNTGISPIKIELQIFGKAILDWKVGGSQFCTAL